MSLDPHLFTKIQRRPTSHQNAWHGEYQTYRLKFEIPAVRVHGHSTSKVGDWFAVDQYNLSVSTYQSLYALLSKYKKPDLEIFLLVPGTVVNVGKAKSQGLFPGGGLQFEVVGKPRPMHLEHVENVKRVKF